MKFSFIRQNSSLKFTIYKNYYHFSKKMITLNDISELNAKHVHMKDKDEVMTKINSLIRDGHNNLQVVSDYDMTLTKQHTNGKPHLSSFSILRICPSVPESYVEKEKAIFDIYRPIEYDPFMPHDEKLKHMQDWWRKSEELLKGIVLTPTELENTIKKHEQVLREGTIDMIKDLHKVQVPVLVFSAGVGNIVEAILKHNKVLLPNVKIISNFLDFDENYKILGYSSDVIHVLNKNEHILEGTDYFDLIKNRENVILMGDHLGDAKMVDGVAHRKTVLKIGFLYERIEENLKNYMEAFDIVLIDDQTMDVARAILKLILAQ